MGMNCSRIPPIKFSVSVKMADECELENHSREISRDIPDEVLFEDILVRLPVKSLIAYKSVCKTWLYTIESRSFIEAHRRRHCCDYSDQIVFTSFKCVFDPITNSASLLPKTQPFVEGFIKMTYRPLDVMLPPEMTRILQPDSAHITLVNFCWMDAITVLGPIRTTGIYCLISYLHRSAYKYQDFLDVKIAICNPATRDYKLASPFPSEEMPRKISELAAKNHCRARYGFGVAADGDYKVVVVIFCTQSFGFGSFLSYVYSMRQGAWKMIVDSENGMVSRLDLRGKQGFPYIRENNLELCPQVFFNGCWHWIALFKDLTLNVLSFNVDNEEFKLVLGPPSYRERMLVDGMEYSSTVSVLNGHLALLDHWYYLDINVINVWMMMEYGDEESWINVWKVNLKCYGIKTLVGITYSLREDSNGGIQIDRVLFQDFIGRLVSCDEFGKVVKQPQLCHFNNSSCIFWNTLGISAYSETLERLSPSKRIASTT